MPTTYTKPPLSASCCAGATASGAPFGETAPAARMATGERGEERGDGGDSRVRGSARRGAPDAAAAQQLNRAGNAPEWASRPQTAVRPLMLVQMNATRPVASGTGVGIVHGDIWAAQDFAEIGAARRSTIATEAPVSALMEMTVRVVGLT